MTTAGGATASGGSGSGESGSRTSGSGMSGTSAGPGAQFNLADTVNAVQGGDMHVYQWKPGYRIEDFPAAPRKVRPGVLAGQPSRLLWAGHRIVPFSGRADDLAALERWRDDPLDGGLTVRLLHGAGGHGKTRLAARFAGLSRDAGWTVWQAATNTAGARRPQDAPLPGRGRGVLLVVDYAERWPVHTLYELLQEPLLHQGPAVRVLLLARPAGAWWQSLAGWLDRTLDVPAHPHPLPPLAGTPDLRARLFAQARDEFARHLGLPGDEAALIAAPAGVDEDPEYAQVLTLHIAALAAVDAVLHRHDIPADPARASAYLLERERAYWTALHQRPDAPLATGPVTMGRAVLTAALTHPLARSHAWSALARAGLAEAAATANPVLDDHQYCYPPARQDTVLEPLYPDRLAEDFIGLTTPGHTLAGAVTDDWADQVARRLLTTEPPGSTASTGSTGTAGPTDARAPAGPATPVPWARPAMTVLIETARRWPHIATTQLYPLLTAHPELAVQAGGSALTALAGMADIDPAVLEAVAPHLPEGRHTDLDVGAATVAYRLAPGRLATSQDPLEHARIYDHLSTRLSYAGLHTEALTAARAGLAVWRRLSRDDPAAHGPALAATLSDVGNRLSAVGRRAEALAAAEEAAGIHRRLAAAEPGEHERNLAAALSNLGIQLSDAGRRAEALATAEQAVEVYRRLAAADPAAHEPGLAGALTNLGNHLSAAGRRDRALTAELQAVRIRRRLAAADPDASEPDLATSLANLGVRLSELGRGAEALAATEEAVEVYRRLARVGPAAYEPGLAAALSGLGNHLSAAGRADDALAATREAVEIRRRLAAAAPAAHEHHLATSLSDLGSHLSAAGHKEDALTAAEEAVAVRRRLARGNPAAHEHHLAAALTNLGIHRSAAGQDDKALAPAEEAVETYRRLAHAHPAAFEPGLAAALSNLGNRLSAAGRGGESLATERQAVEIRRRLARADPAVHAPGLAASLTNLGVRLAEAGRRTEARTAADEAVALYRKLAADRPGAHDAALAASLRAREWVRSR